MTEGQGQSFCRQNAADHIIAGNRSSQFFDGGGNILQRQQGHAAKAAVTGEKSLVEIIVVGAAKLRGVGGIADLADMHETGRVENGERDTAFIQFAGSLTPVGHTKILVAVVVGGNRAVPAMVRHQGKVKHGIAPRAVACGHIFNDLGIGLAHVAVGIDDAGGGLC
jgi:hypothetical protein